MDRVWLNCLVPQWLGAAPHIHHHLSLSFCPLSSVRFLPNHPITAAPPRSPVSCLHLTRGLRPCRRHILGTEPLLPWAWKFFSWGEGVPWRLRRTGEAPVGGTRTPFGEETLYHPLLLAASQGFLPPVSLLILLIYLKELRKRRGAPAGARTGAQTPDPHACFPEEPSSTDQISFSYK